MYRGIRQIRSRMGAEFSGLVRDSFFAGIAQASVSVADLAQIALVAHILGLQEYGRLALIVAFVALVGQFVDVRVSTAATAHAARAVERSPTVATGIFQFSYIIDSLTGVAGFAVIAALAPFVGPALIGDGGTVLLVLFGATLLFSVGDDTSRSILRVFDRFELVAVVTLLTELVRLGLVVGALLLFGSLQAVVVALLIQDAAAAAVSVIVASRVHRRASGGLALSRSALRVAGPEAKSMLRMIVHTNVLAYSRTASVQLPTVLLGALASTTEVALYKVGMAVAVAVNRLTDPLLASVLPRFARLWAAGRREELRALIWQIALVSLPMITLGLALVIVFREALVEGLGGGEAARGATSVVIYGAVGQTVSAAAFWSVPLLWAADRGRSVSRMVVVGAGVQISLLLALIPWLGAVGAAIAFLVSTLVITVQATWSGGRLLFGMEASASSGASDAEARVVLP